MDCEFEAYPAIPLKTSTIVCPTNGPSEAINHHKTSSSQAYKALPNTQLIYARDEKALLTFP